MDEWPWTEVLGFPQALTLTFFLFSEAWREQILSGQRCTGASEACAECAMAHSPTKYVTVHVPGSLHCCIFDPPAYAFFGSQAGVHTQVRRRQCG